MQGRVKVGSAARWFASFTGVILTQLWGCSPVDITDELDTSREPIDAAVTFAGERSSATEPERTTGGKPQTTAPGTPTPATTAPGTTTPSSEPRSSDSSFVAVTEGTTPSVETTEPLVAGSSEADPTSDGPEPPVDPECLATAVEPMPTGLEGFAKVAGYNVVQTVGGLDGEVVYVGSERALRAQLQANEPRVVVVCGEIVLSERLTITSNKTLLGLGPTSILRGGIDIRGAEAGYVSNIIVANLVLDPSMLVYDEGFESLAGVRVEYAHHVWLDHLEVYNAPEGLVDVVWGSDLVTLSWNKLYFTQEWFDNVERRFAVRVGDVIDDSVLARDGGKLRVTLHHNWFGDFIRQRMPRVAYGQAHIVNNYYSVTGNDTAIWGLSQYAQLLVQSNYFAGTHRPHDIPLSSELVNDELAQIVASGNVYYGTTGERRTQGTAFELPYDLVKDSTVWLPSLVPWGAGPHASFEPMPPWSDAGAIAPDPDMDAGVTPPHETSSAEMSSATDAPDASASGAEFVEDASLGDASSTGD